MSRSSESGRLRIAITFIALVGAACSPTNPKPSPPATTPHATTIDIACTPERTEVAPALRGDPCPDAITAVELAVAPVRLPISRIAIEPGPFYCDDVWPGAGSQPACYGVLVQPGQYMHAWASFERSNEVAAVMLGRDIPSNLDVPAAQPLPWSATLVTVEVPPAGWSMP